MSSSATVREQYFCIVCGCLATPRDKQILFDGEPQVSIHHNCYNNIYQPLSRAEIQSTFITSYGDVAVKHALTAARHAAGPNSIDGDPQEFYLRHEVLTAIRKYREVNSDRKFEFRIFPDIFRLFGPRNFRPDI